MEITVKPEKEWKTRVLQANAARVLQKDGRAVVGVVTILRDVTQQIEINKMKTELVSMVARMKLRSPLTSISGFSELLLDNDSSPEQNTEYAKIILEETNRLTDLVNKFLDISRIESGRIQPNKISIDLSDIIRIVTGNHSQKSSRKNIEICIHENETVPEVYADYGMMEQVFINLITNALKYSPADSRIDIHLYETGQYVRVDIKDQGYGIPEEALAKIFDKFYRVSTEESENHETGSGLGLSLVKHIVEMHKGVIDVSSRLGEGSVFSVSLPQITKEHLERV
ncbi:MAG: HAMP domain-containing sensor histidine kinase [candidate division KSB1 bacterium]|nr:HAMP domain-containing sensor histidine kinase [candidate division KSB1 bacterium]